MRSGAWRAGQSPCPPTSIIYARRAEFVLRRRATRIATVAGNRTSLRWAVIKPHCARVSERVGDIWPMWTRAMQSDTNPMERAYELARSGRFLKIEDLVRALKAERYDNVHAHIMGRGTRTQLTKLMTAARPCAQQPPNEKRQPDSDADAQAERLVP